MKTPKKVLLLSQFSPPETNSAANRVGAMAKKLAEHYRVCMVALKPSYPSSSLYKGFQLEYHDHALPYQIKRTFGFDPHKGALLARAMREHAMAVRLMVSAARTPADIVVASSPSMFLGPVGFMLARAKRARFVWDVRDITWRYVKEVVGASRGVALGARALEAYMLSVVRRTDLLVGATPGISQVLVESGAEPSKVVTVLNGISEDMLGILQEVSHSAAHRRPVVTYAGLIGYNQALGVVLDTARALPDVDFVLAGDGPELPLLKRRAQELSLKNVRFEGWLDREQLLNLYKESDVLLAHTKSTPILDNTSINSKLFEYMATGRPFVYGGKGLAPEFLSNIGCAVIIPPENPQAMSAAISALLQDPRRMYTLGLKGRAFVERNVRRDKLMEELTRTLKERFAP